jgi:hypothetical protein
MPRVETLDAAAASGARRTAAIGGLWWRRPCRPLIMQWRAFYP